MASIRLSIPAFFINARARLTWREALYGIDEELLEPGAAVELAGVALATHDNPSATLVELAARGEGEPTRELVARLAEAEPALAADAIREKWLYLALAWIFEHRADYADPLQAVEEVYAARRWHRAAT